MPPVVFMSMRTLRAERSRSSLAFAMLDLDYFIKDTYGHVMSERVIKSLSRLL